MSFYFSQLLTASGVGSAPRRTPGSATHDGGGTPAVSLPEITDQVPSTPVLPPRAAAEPPAAPLPMRDAPIQSASPDSAPPPPPGDTLQHMHLESVSPAAPTSPADQSSVIAPPPATPAPGSPREVIEIVRARPELSQRPVDRPPPSRHDPQASREEILAAVMKWVATAEAPALPDPSHEPAAEPPAEHDTKAGAPPIPIDTERPSRPIAAIETVVQEAIAAPAPRPAPARPFSDQRTPMPAAPSLPSVSIGSVHLRIETPPPQTPRTAPAPPQPRQRSAPPTRAPGGSRSGGLMKLRRHYILPH